MQFLDSLNMATFTHLNLQVRDIRAAAAVAVNEASMTDIGLQHSELMDLPMFGSAGVRRGSAMMNNVHGSL